MPKFKIFSDIHVHPWTAFAKITKSGLNSRLAEIVGVLKKIIEAAHEESCDAILFSGDLFHVPKTDAVTMDLVARALRRSEIPIVMIPGNHDEAEKMAHYHTMRSLHGLAKCIVLDDREGRSVEISGTKIGGIPFTSSNRDFYRCLARLQDSDLVLAHTGFAGATAGFDYIADQKHFVQPHRMKLEDTRIKLVIAGHFHQPQMMSPENGYDSRKIVDEESVRKFKEGSILVPGAPVQHNYGDIGSLRGSWTLDLERKSLKFIPSHCPNFVRLQFRPKELGTFERLSSGNYVACKVSQEGDFQAACEVLREKAKGFTVTVEKDVEAENKGRPRIRLGMSSKKVLKKYIKKTIPPNHSVAGLLKTGMKLLREAESSD